MLCRLYTVDGASLRIVNTKNKKTIPTLHQHFTLGKKNHNKKVWERKSVQPISTNHRVASSKQNERENGKLIATVPLPAHRWREWCPSTDRRGGRAGGEEGGAYSSSCWFDSQFLIFFCNILHWVEPGNLWLVLRVDGWCDCETLTVYISICSSISI